jgi:hypothetical protein
VDDVNEGALDAGSLGDVGRSEGGEACFWDVGVSAVSMVAVAIDSTDDCTEADFFFFLRFFFFVLEGGAV